MKTSQDILIWNKAKEIASIKEKSSDWVYIVTIYTYLGGKLKNITYTKNKERFYIVGELSDKIAIVYNSKKDEFDFLPKSFVELQPKMYTTLDPSKGIVPLYTLNRKDLPLVYRENNQNPVLLNDVPIIGYTNDRSKNLL